MYYLLRQQVQGVFTLHYICFSLITFVRVHTSVYKNLMCYAVTCPSIFHSCYCRLSYLPPEMITNSHKKKKHLIKYSTWSIQCLYNAIINFSFDIIQLFVLSTLTHSVSNMCIQTTRIKYAPTCVSLNIIRI